MANSSSKRKLLVLLIDGFRWDYFDIPGLELPGFNYLFKNGVKSKYMIPEFPSLSFPNYYSIATGCHVEDHSFVGNFMYNEEKNHGFELTLKSKESQMSHWFEEAEPVWIAAVKQGKRTFMYEWPGGHVKHKGLSSTFSKPMVDWPLITHMEANLKEAFKMFKEDKIDMAGVFVDSVDQYGHRYGPNSKQLSDVVKEIDEAIQRMFNSLAAESLENKVNIVIFSDHGMTETSESRTIDISQHIGSDDVEAVMDKGAVCSVWPKSGKLEKVYNGLKSMKHSHMTVYKKTELPDRWCYKNNKLVAPVTIVADLGWYILTPEYMYFDGPCKGNHGYDNNEKDMRGIFLATGPDFKTNHECGPVKAVDIYQVMCKAGDIQPQTHRGTWSSVEDIFA